MIAPNHMRWAAGCWIVTATWLKIPLTPIDLGIATISGLAPDLDTPKSSIGKRLPFISHPLGMIVGHRGLTHSLLAATLCVFGIVWGIGVQQSQPLYHLLLLPFLIGYLSHLIGDMMNPSGVPLLWPYPQRYTFPLICWSYKSPIEFVFTWLFLGGAIYGWWASGGYALSAAVIKNWGGYLFP